MTRGWLITRGAAGKDAAGEAPVTVKLIELDDAALAPVAGTIADVDVAVTWSSINYKDALAFTGNKGVARLSPLVPGIDIVGRVTASRSSRWSVGDRVVLNGAGAGETRHGGLAERAVLDGATLVSTPSSLTDAQAAGIGTAGFTAMLAVLALERHDVTRGEVLVTGASGGLGSFAIALLSKAGFTVTAATGRPDSAAELRALGATTILDRAELDRPARALESQRYAGVIDAVGGRILAAALAQLEQGGAAVACGNAASASLETTVMPFILRGVALLGVNSTVTALALREQAWLRLTRDLDPAVVDRIAHPIELADAQTAAARLLVGGVRGRLSVRVSPDGPTAATS